MWAATAPELEQSSGAYLADCHVEEPHAIAQDPHTAEQLWQVGRPAHSQQSGLFVMGASRMVDDCDGLLRQHGLLHGLPLAASTHHMYPLMMGTVSCYPGSKCAWLSTDCRLPSSTCGGLQHSQHSAAAC